MITFSIGFVAGALVTLTILIFVLPHRRLIEKLMTKVEDEGVKSFYRKTEQVVFIEPTPIEDEAVATVIKENELRGKDTKVDEL